MVVLEQRIRKLYENLLFIFAYVVFLVVLVHVIGDGCGLLVNLGLGKEVDVEVGTEDFLDAGGKVNSVRDGETRAEGGGVIEDLGNLLRVLIIGLVGLDALEELDNDGVLGVDLEGLHT